MDAAQQSEKTADREQQDGENNADQPLDHRPRPARARVWQSCAFWSSSA